MTLPGILALATALSVAGCGAQVADPTEVASAACAPDGAGACSTDADACRDWPGYACCAVADGCACVSDASRCQR